MRNGRTLTNKQDYWNRRCGGVTWSILKFIIDGGKVLPKRVRGLAAFRTIKQEGERQEQKGMRATWSDQYIAVYTPPTTERASRITQIFTTLIQNRLKLRRGGSGSSNITTVKSITNSVSINTEKKRIH